MDSLHDVLHSDFGTNIFQYLSIHCIYSSFISVSSSSRKYFEKMSNLSLLKQLICYDFPLIFLIDTTLNDRLKRHQLSSSLNVNSLISIIYTNISALSISRTLLYGSDENLLDINFSKNLTMAMRCGGILGIRHYIKRISKIKNIPIKNLYRVQQLIPIGPNLELKVLRWKYLIPEIAKAIVKASNGNRRPYHITDIWMYNAFEVYLNHFAKDGMMIDQPQKVYLEHFQRFMVNHISLFLRSNKFYISDTLKVILQTDLMNEFDGLFLFKNLFCRLFSQDGSCIKYATSEHSEVFDQNCMRDCEWIERIPIEAILSISNKKMVLKCYEQLCDNNSEIVNILCVLNTHLILCWRNRNSNVTRSIQLNIQCVDVDLAQKVIQKYEAILYRNCHNAIKPGSNIYQLT
eukprot:452805_1